jgi:ABC-type Fe3+ transport system permease subunit
MQSVDTQLINAVISSSDWTKIILVGIFTLGVVLVILIPFATDIVNAHKTWREIVAKDPDAVKNQTGPGGVQGLARATMAFGVLTVIGFALGYILVEQPFNDNKTIASNILVALTTTLAAVTAFYFGGRLASEARRDAARGSEASDITGREPPPKA